jgi:hypothetical protein
MALSAKMDRVDPSKDKHPQRMVVSSFLFSLIGKQREGWVKSGKAQAEHMFSALPPKADMRRRSLIVP